MMADRTMQNILALVIVVGFIGMMLFWTVVPPPENPSVLGMMQILLGLLGAAATAVTSYYFGSSSGSKDKDTTIGDIAKSSTNTPNPTPTEPEIAHPLSDDDLGDPLPKPAKA